MCIRDRVGGWQFESDRRAGEPGQVPFEVVDLRRPVAHDHPSGVEAAVTSGETKVIGQQHRHVGRHHAPTQDGHHLIGSRTHGHHPTARRSPHLAPGSQ